MKSISSLLAHTFANTTKVPASRASPFTFAIANPRSSHIYSFFTAEITAVVLKFNNYILSNVAIHLSRAGISH